MMKNKEKRGIYSSDFIDFVNFLVTLTDNSVNLEDFARNMEKVYGFELATLRRKDILASPEGSLKRPNVPQTVGEKLYPDLSWERLQEYNRTLMFCYLFYLISHEKYDEFVACQKQEIKLSRESFNMLVVLVESVINKEKADFFINMLMMSDLLMADASIHDLGKVRGISEMYRLSTGTKGEVADHDEPLLYLLENAPEEISPSFVRMTNEQKKFLKEVLSINYNFGQLPQGENLPANLLELHNVDTNVLLFWILKSYLDIAGAGGAAIQNGSAVLTQPVFDGLTIAQKAIMRYHDSGNELGAYVWHLQQRAKIVGLSNDMADVKNCALSRLTCLARIYSHEELIILQKAFELLTSQGKKILMNELSYSGLNGKVGILPYYAPGLFANLKRIEWKNKKDVVKIYKLGLLVLTRVLSLGRAYVDSNIDSDEGVFILNIHDVVNYAKKNPNNLDNATQEMFVEKAGEHGIIRFNHNVKINKW